MMPNPLAWGNMVGEKWGWENCHHRRPDQQAGSGADQANEATRDPPGLPEMISCNSDYDPLGLKPRSHGLYGMADAGKMTQGSKSMQSTHLSRLLVL
jgi:hypothetical protein